MLKNNVGPRLYELSTQYSWQRTISPNLLKKESQIIPFVSPPFVALLFLPLAQLPINQAYIVWGFINIGIFTLTLLLLLSLFKPVVINKPIFSIFILGITSYFSPLWSTLFQGQFSILLLLGFTLALVALQHHHPTRAGIALALIALKPHLLLLVVALLLWKRQWQTLKGLAVALSCLLIISLMLVNLTGIGSYLSLLVWLTSIGEGYAFHPQFEPTLRGALQALLGINTFTPISFFYLVGVFIIGGITAIIFRGQWKPTTIIFKAQWSALIIATILTSIHTNFHDLLLLLIPIYSLSLQALQTYRNQGTHLGLIISLILLGLGVVFLFSAGEYFPPFLAAPLTAVLIFMALSSLRKTS